MDEQTSNTPSSGTDEQQGTETPTLDDVYKEYGIEDQAAQFQQNRQAQQNPQPQQSQPRQEPPPLAVPDPTLDPQGYRDYEQRKLQDSQSLRQTLSQVAGQLTQMQAQAVRATEEADIRKAVGVLKEKVQGVDDDMLEIALGHKARKDPKFMSLWQQRAQKPEAWNKALQAVAGEIGSKFSARQDPQLTENTRAMKAAAQAASTSRTGKGDDEWPSDQREFQKKWDSYVSSGGY
jgi:hypothetical protein